MAGAFRRRHSEQQHQRRHDQRDTDQEGSGDTETRKHHAGERRAHCATERDRTLIGPEHGPALMCLGFLPGRRRWLGPDLSLQEIAEQVIEAQKRG